MMEIKDPAIKLFGQTIPLPADREFPATSGDGSTGEGLGSFGDENSEMEEEEKDESGPREEEIEEEKDLQASKPTENNEQKDNAPSSLVSNESMNPETSPEPSENPKTPSIEEENAASRTSKTENEQNEKSSTQDKTLKKPNKIVPCPRCNSVETKFCYYNNYNVNQPRHFCKNCQRYWTNGGTMRNVPVGAGCRKNKNSASDPYRRISIPEALQTAQINASNGIHNHDPTLKTNATVLNFGSDASLSESTASALNIAEKTMWSGARSGFHKPEQPEVLVPSRVVENSDDHSSGSSIVGSNSMEEPGKSCTQEPSMQQTFHSFHPQIPCLPGIPWPYPWNGTFCHPAIPMFYPTSYWNSTLPGAWPVPLLSPPSVSSEPSVSSSGPTLGKHSRDGNALEPGDSAEAEELPKQKNPERNIWVPKTLRIDDPDEAAKSSIWATLGIKNESICKGGFFKGCQAKGHEKNRANESSLLMQANPAALSRSLNFHESS